MCSDLWLRYIWQLLCDSSVISSIYRIYVDNPDGLLGCAIVLSFLRFRSWQLCFLFWYCWLLFFALWLVFLFNLIILTSLTFFFSLFFLELFLTLLFHFFLRFFRTSSDRKSLFQANLLLNIKIRLLSMTLFGHLQILGVYWLYFFWLFRRFWFLFLFLLFLFGNFLFNFFFLFFFNSLLLLNLPLLFFFFLD